MKLKVDNKRHILKTITWRVVAFLTTTILAWLITGDYKIGLGIGGVEFVVKSLLYYLHERVWFKYVRINEKNMNRKDVYKAIDTERMYQDKIWNEHTTSSGGVHSPEEWIIYVEDYLREAKTLLSRNSISDAEGDVMDIFRKCAAMLVCAGEQRGMSERQPKPKSIFS